jgi:hypothetical protein
VKSKGRKYELELMQRLRLLGLTVKDVAPNTGEYAEHDCDLLIERAGESLRGEVKFRHKGQGFLRIYQRHEEESLGHPILWTKDMVPYWSGSLKQWAHWPYTQDCYEVTASISSTVEGWLAGRDVVFLRMAHRQWIAVWR